MELTILAESEYERIGAGDMTPEMAAKYLSEGRLALRGFDEVLRELYPQPDIRERLCAALLAD